MHIVFSHGDCFAHKIKQTDRLKQCLRTMTCSELLKNQTLVTRCHRTSAHPLVMSPILSALRVVFSNPDTGHKCCSCTISLFMDGGGNSSQQNTDCLLDPLGEAVHW